jgi:hypothetical protein
MRATPIRSPGRRATAAPEPAPRPNQRASRIVRPPNIIQAMDDPLTFSHPSIGHPFTNESWDNWKTVLKAGDGLPMTTAETEFFKSISGGREPPSARVREQWWVVGRRGGKDSVASFLAAHTAATFTQTHLLRGGERALVICIAPTREQAQIVLRFIKAYFTDVPLLAAMLEGEIKQEGFSLTNGIDIKVGTNSFKEGFQPRTRSPVCCTRSTRNTSARTTMTSWSSRRRRGR